jgi:hypothetical protein
MADTDADGMTPALILRPHGRLGNHILQWVTGQTLAFAVPGLTLHNFALPPWGLGAGGFWRKQPFLPAVAVNDTDLALVAELMRSGEMPLARLSGIIMQPDAWADVARFRALLPLGTQAVETSGPDEILLNVRADEILKARHKDYGPIPLGFYTAVLRETGLKPVFMGQLGNDSYSRLLRDTFPQARFIPSQGVMGDFDAMRRARHLAVSVSTFSWAAGWLSQAESLHMPLLGFFNPAQRPDIALMPKDDARFHYYGFAPRRWMATEAQVAELHDLVPAPLLAPDAVAAIRAAADATRKAGRAADSERLREEARRTRPYIALLRRIYATW